VKDLYRKILCLFRGHVRCSACALDEHWINWMHCDRCGMAYR